jgi:hypothetical protein
MKSKILSQAKECFFFNTTINIFFFIALVLLIVAKYIFGISLTPNEQGHYYFFSSVAQSMAAIIALAGSVGVFIYSNISEKLKRLKQLTREQFTADSWTRHIGNTESLTWRDDEVIARAKALNTETRPPHIRAVLLGLIAEMERIQKSLDAYIPSALPSLLSTTVSFFMSLTFIPISSWLIRASIGDIFILFSLLLVAISLRNIYGFFKSSLH